MLLEKSKELVREADSVAERLNAVDTGIRCVAHYDCDGIASGVIVHEMLERAGKAFELCFVEELDRENLEDLASGAEEDVWMFVDIGSGQIDDIAEVLDDEEVVILDHHEPAEGEVDHHLNPHEVGIDGGENISGAGVTYLVARTMGEENQDLLKYALVGATGDIQEEDGDYLGLNETMMEDAEELGLVERKKGLRLYGRTRKSIVEAFKYTTDPFLPGISNDESGAVQFLSEVGVQLRENGGWRSLEDLSLEEEKRIVHDLITRGYDVDGLLGDIYILDNGWEIREFSSLLNACGRLGRAEDGLRICLEEDFQLAETIKRDYGRKIGSYLSFVEDNMDEEAVREFTVGSCIVAEENIDPNMIGTVTTICQKSGILDGRIHLGMSWKGEENTKVSARAGNEVVENGLKMNELVEELAERFGGEGGGHDAAAGAKIPRDEEERFMEEFFAEAETRL